MLPLRVFAPFAFGYFLSYLFRAVNAVAGPGIAGDLGIEPAALGLLTSVYFLTFASVQLPLGVLLDRYGANRVEAALLVFAAAGSALFAVGGDLATVTLGRALIGFGVSAGLMAAFKAYSTLVPPERLPFVNGLHLAVGGLGMLAGGLPSELAMDVLGWRGLFAGLAVLCLVASAMLWTVAATPIPVRGGDSFADQFRAVGRILVGRPFLRIAPACTAAQTAALALQSLWAGPWLRDVAGFDPRTAAAILSTMALAMTAGFLVSGWAAARLIRSGIPLETTTIGGMILIFVSLVLVPLLPPVAAVVSWTAFAFLAPTSMLAYPLLTAAHAPALSGRVNATLNFVVFVTTFFGQWGYGVLLQALTGPLGLQGAHAAGILLFAGLLALSLVWAVVDRRRG
jgi:predicted MFS family arabinose efflux permease